MPLDIVHAHFDCAVLLTIALLLWCRANNLCMVGKGSVLVLQSRLIVTGARDRPQSTDFVATTLAEPQAPVSWQARHLVNLEEQDFVASTAWQTSSADFVSC